jgi:hypothetical protein
VTRLEDVDSELIVLQHTACCAFSLCVETRTCPPAFVRAHSVRSRSDLVSSVTTVLRSASGQYDPLLWDVWMMPWRGRKNRVRRSRASNVGLSSKPWTSFADTSGLFVPPRTTRCALSDPHSDAGTGSRPPACHSDVAEFITTSGRSPTRNKSRPMVDRSSRLGHRHTWRDSQQRSACASHYGRARRAVRRGH